MISNPPIDNPLPVDKSGAFWTPPWGNFMNRAYQILFAQEQAGITAARPTKGLWIARPYFDTTLGYPIWWNGTAWVDATGTPA